MSNNSTLFDANEIYNNNKEWIPLNYLMNRLRGEKYQIDETYGNYHDGTKIYHVCICERHTQIGRYFGKMDIKTNKIIFNVEPWDAYNSFIRRDYSKYNN